MTTEEKLQHFYEVSIESAKEEADNAISEYRTSLEKELEKHKKEKLAASENQFKIESENAAREINKALSAEHLHIKRRLSKKYQELQEKLFEEVKEMLQTFLAGPQYGDWLEEKINKLSSDYEFLFDDQLPIQEKIHKFIKRKYKRDVSEEKIMDLLNINSENK